jgi:aldehyde dehydrogenase family 7 protein A1
MRVRRFYQTVTRATEFSKHEKLFKELGLEEENMGVYNGKWSGGSHIRHSVNPATNHIIGSIRLGSPKDIQDTLLVMEKIKPQWRAMPMPKRGEIVRQMRVALDQKKQALGQLVSLEMGKILPEGVGEVQEYIDICDYATGLSRIVGGSTVPSERPGHFMMEEWNPLGTVGVISAFNFPVAVYGWNSALALTLGNSV